MARVLVVEDNELNLKLFCDLLSIKNHEVVVSRDGHNIFEIIEENNPSLILMDIQLGSLSGLDLIVELKGDSKTSGIPIIAITAFAMKNDEAIISRSGCDMYMSKPVSIENFFQAIDKYIEIECEA